MANGTSDPRPREPEEPRSSPGPGPAGSTFAARLDHLFRTVHPQGRGEYSYREVAKAIDDRHGPTTISASYLNQLRTGVKDNPTKRHIEALATFFGVPAAYFFDDGAASRIDAELDLLAALRDSGVRQIAMRAAGLPPQGLESVRQMIELARSVSGLEAAEDTDGTDDSGGVTDGEGPGPA
jgi:transcriptional regulator with XRE-family HTH domain